jgi:hypothetical protein
MLSSNQDLPLWDWDSLAPTSEPIITVFLFGIGIASSTSEPIQLVWDSCAAGGLLQLKLHRHRCSVARSHVVGFAPVGGRIVVTVDWLATTSRWPPYDIFLASCKSFMYLSVRLDVVRLTPKWDFLTGLSLNVYLCSLHSYSRTPHWVYYLTEQSIVSTIWLYPNPTEHNFSRFCNMKFFRRHIDSTFGEKILGIKPWLEPKIPCQIIDSSKSNLTC